MELSFSVEKYDNDRNYRESFLTVMETVKTARNVDVVKFNVVHMSGNAHCFTPKDGEKEIPMDVVRKIVEVVCEVHDSDD